VLAYEPGWLKADLYSAGTVGCLVPVAAAGSVLLGVLAVELLLLVLLVGLPPPMESDAQAQRPAYDTMAPLSSNEHAIINGAFVKSTATGPPSELM